MILNVYEQHEANKLAAEQCVGERDKNVTFVTTLVSAIITPMILNLSIGRSDDWVAAIVWWCEHGSGVKRIARVALAVRRVAAC